MLKIFSTLLLVSLLFNANAQTKSFFMFTKTSLGGAHYRAITVPHTNVTTTLTSFPVLISGTYTYLKTVANGGEVQNTNGYDITFSSDAGGTSLYKWDVEMYNPATGQIAIWVNIPSLSSTVDNTIYMRYNQAGITTFQGGTAGTTWDANYYSVWHMKEQLTGSGQTVSDASGNGNNLTSSGTWTTGQQVTGQVGNALQAINANSDFFTFPTVGFASSFTIEGWFNLTSASNTTFTFGHNSFANDCNFFSGDYRLYNGGGDQIVDGNTTSTGVWTHLVITNNAGAYTVYHNGASSATASPTAFTFNFSRLYENLTTISSTISGDEVRISSIARSAGWVATEYSNMSNPATFYSIGSEN